jgi:ElaB/YqjD/DUF883 family membrane-anchored ribosome-binding protein
MVDRITGYGSIPELPAEQMRERALELGAVARERFVQGSDALREFTIRKPAQALGLALAMGVALGWLIKRR